MLKLVKTELVPVTKVVAKRFRDMEGLKNERDLKATRAKAHVDLIARQKFFTPLWGQCEYASQTYRGNGNHTSHVLLACIQAHNGGLDAKSEQFFKSHLVTRGGKWTGESATDLPEVKEGEITAVVECFSADDETDLVDFFCRYDSRESVRQPADILGIYIGEQDDLSNLSRDRIRNALKGVLRAAKADPEDYGVTPDFLSLHSGDRTGMVLRNPKVRSVTKWIVETVPDADLYKSPIGAQICADVHAQHGPVKGEKIIAELVRQIENDEDPGAGWEAMLTKRRNRPTEESLYKKGCQAIKTIYQSLA